MNYLARYQLKNQAKDRLFGKYPSVILLLLTQDTLRLFTYMTAISIVPLRSIVSMVTLLIFLFLLSIILNVLQVGNALFYLNIACGQPYSVSNLFHGFREQSNKCLLLSCVTSVLSFPQVLTLVCSSLESIQWMLYAYIFAFVFEVLFLPLTLGLSQCYFLILDYPKLTVGETIKMSFRIMRGHKLRLLGLQMSFLPLVLFASFTFSIGFLWVTPYMQMTYTIFFLDLMMPKNATS